MRQDYSFCQDAIYRLDARLCSGRRRVLGTVTARDTITWSIDDLERLASAIQDPTRRSILLAFYRGGEPMTVDQVAMAAGIHRTVAFTHLEKLVALGYLEATRRRGFPGKPAKVYKRASDSPLRFDFPARQFGLLSKVLIQALNSYGTKGAGVAREAGRACGALLGANGVTLAAVIQSVAFLGADYRLVDERMLVAENCIFREACSADRGLVCSLHSGLIEGMLTSAGLDFEATPADPDGATCAYRLTPALSA